MKSKLYLVIALLAVAGPSVAQVPEDAIRASWYAPFGTARHQAIGGAMGSLGGEISFHICESRRPGYVQEQ